MSFREPKGELGRGRSHTVRQALSARDAVRSLCRSWYFLQLPFDPRPYTSAPMVRLRVDGMPCPWALVGDSHHGVRVPTESSGPTRVSEPDECPHQAGFHRCGSGRRNGGGRIVSGSDRPSRATLSTPARAAAKVAVSPEVEIPGLPRPLRQGEINRRELPPIPSPLHPPYPAPQPDRWASAPVRTP